jgi:hypothetical protein
VAKAALVAAGALSVVVWPLGTTAADVRVVHEPVPEDLQEDAALHVTTDDELPPAISVGGMLLRAPDATRPVVGDGAAAAPRGLETREGAAFVPDLDTRVPQVPSYEDPFRPSTAPWKRLYSFDSIDANYTLRVANAHIEPIVARGAPARDGDEDSFFADIPIVTGMPGWLRIPSVAPGARVVRASLSSDGHRYGFRLGKDSAENWFVEVSRALRGRLVMELAAPRGSFGGPMLAPSGLRAPPPPLPAQAESAARRVLARIGVSRGEDFRTAVSKLVAYFRSFSPTEESIRGSGDIYLDLALGKRGVCRHRAFAFFVTARALRIPTRVVMNASHAWVEVEDGTGFRRIDLGGAGVAASEPMATVARHTPRADPFPWPRDATRGDDLLAPAARDADATKDEADSESAATGATGGRPRSGARAAPGGAASQTSRDGPSASSSGSPSGSFGLTATDASGAPVLPPSTLQIEPLSARTRRSASLEVRGVVRPGAGILHASCGQVAVEVFLRREGETSAAADEHALGMLATEGDGTFHGSVRVPSALRVGRYALVAKTHGNATCGPGASP